MININYKHFLLELSENIYIPSEDTHLFLNFLEKTLKNKTFKQSLEIGGGSGILSLCLQNVCKNHTIIDINPLVIEHLNNLKKKYNLNWNIVCSNLFDKINSQKYDLIIFNPPYVPSEPLHKSKDIDYAVDGGKNGSETIIKFLNVLPSYLNKKGVCYLLVSSLNNFKNIFKYIKNKGLTYEVVDETKLFFEKLIILKIYFKE